MKSTVPIKSTVKRVMMSIVVLSFLSIAGVAYAEGDIVEEALEICAADIETYCSQVTLGEGRLLACFAAHEDKISGQCSWALYETMAELETFVSAIAYVADSCMDDMIEHCAEVELGEGRVATCLVENKDKVSDGCSQAMDDVELEVVEE